MYNIKTSSANTMCRNLETLALYVFLDSKAILMYNCMPKPGTFKFGDFLRLILGILQ